MQQFKMNGSKLFRLVTCLRVITWVAILQFGYCFPSSDNAYTNYADNDIYGAPIITPTESDITLEVNTTYTLSCESSEPSIWRVPASNDDYILYKIVPFHTQNLNRPYGSHIHLYNVTGHNVGDYFCIPAAYKETDNLEGLITTQKAAKIYVFVNDPDQLIVPDDQILISAFQFSDVIIPCKPTSPDVEVELVNTDNMMVFSDYDVKIGFKLADVNGTITVICKLANSTDETQQKLFTVHVLPRTIHVNKPSIITKNGGHAMQGEKLILDCTVEIPAGVIFSLDWHLPNNDIAKKENRVIISETSKKSDARNDAFEIGSNTLIVERVDKAKDNGYYKCEVKDHSNNINSDIKEISILTKNESYINMSEPSKHYNVVVNSGKAQTKMFVKFRGHPKPRFIWFNNHGEVIDPSITNEKYEIEEKESDISLKIKSVQLQDSGDYYIRATNDLVNEELKFNLKVKEKPSVSVQNVYVKPGQEAILTCECAGYPESVISWLFTPCRITPQWPTCTPTRALDISNDTYATSVMTPLSQISEMKFTPAEPGIAKCIAKNTEGIGKSEAEVLIGDLDEAFTIYGIADNHKIAVGDNLKLTCGAIAYNYSADINWYRDNILINQHDNYEISRENSEYSYKNILKINNIHHGNEGTYECRVSVVADDKEAESKHIILQIYDAQAPIVDSTNLLGSKLDINLGELLELQCKFTGIPLPSVIWYKDDMPLVVGTNETQHITISDDNTLLQIPFIKPEDEGMYKCVVQNRLGIEERSAQVKISNLPGLSLGIILGISGVILLLIIFIIYLCIRVLRERELLKQMKAAGLSNFEEGAVDHINPALSLDEQADLLPYDRRFEFPKEKLKLGKQLGAGAFGVVLKAVAEGIIPEEKETIVAVKMVKKTADNEVMKALVSELKIMVHLGQHLNVVNLLGAVTKNIAKREVMVIVEYCRYGNVQNFLLKNRKRFINQINRDTDTIDPTIQQRWSSDYEYNSANGSRAPNQGLKYVKLSFSHQQLNNSKGEGDRSSGPPTGQLNSKGYIRHSGMDYTDGNMDSCNTEQTLISTIPEGDESIILSNNSVQPAWRSNYKPDGSAAMDITTTQLVSWAFQVARGMDYLSTRKVLHGDLAARNILLCEDNVVKICDFGLARSMYRSDNYKKQGEAPLPIKWLALESLCDQVFNTYTDVWSYGIVLWELFSLAKVPYPGMEADQTLYLKLKDGYRMEKPEYANQELYDIMLQCWSAHAESRPLFNVLEKRFAKMLQDDVSNHYVDLNEPYLRMNSEYYKQGQTDYLALMGCPDESAPQPPRYVNGHIVPDLANKGDDTAPNYLQMTPKSGNVIFSPRPQDDYVTAERFNFPPPPISPTISNNLDSPASKNRKKTGIPEEIPMLKQTHSDSETELSPDAETANKKFSNLDVSPEFKTMLADKDNYINRRSPGDQNKMSTKDAFSNPGYLMLKTVNETKK